MSIRGLGIAALLLIGTASAADTCMTGDHPNCPYWVANGFCTAYPATKGQLCARACGMCSSAACKDADPNCATYPNFCQNRYYTPVQKATFCAKMCNLCNVVIPPTSTKTPDVPGKSCAEVFDDHGDLVSEINLPPEDYPIEFDYLPPQTLKEALVRTGCTLKLSNSRSTATGEIATIAGGAAKQAIPTEYNAAKTATCSCP